MSTLTTWGFAPARPNSPTEPEGFIAVDVCAGSCRRFRHSWRQGGETKALNRAAKRNAERFPDDFMFQLTQEEWGSLRCQIGASSWGGSRVPPYAFTEPGVAMLPSVLRSARAVQVNIAIRRAFVRLREMLLSNAGLARKLADLERKDDSQFKAVFDAIRQLMAPSPVPPKPEIGYHVKEDAIPYGIRKRGKA